jgi:hypothetical protein
MLYDSRWVRRFSRGRIQTLFQTPFDEMTQRRQPLIQLKTCREGIRKKILDKIFYSATMWVFTLMATGGLK